MINAESQLLLDGVESFARGKGLNWDIEALPLYQQTTMRLALETQRLDGIITGFDGNDIMASLALTKMPVVFLRYSDSEPSMRRKRLSVMRLDFGEAGRAAARLYLGQGGYRSFGFVETTRDPRWSRSRGDAFRDAVAATGLPFSRFSTKDGTYQAAVASREEFGALAAWLKSLPKPAAVFAASDERARDTLLACREAGLEVPRAVALIGVNDEEFTCRHIFPNLSSVRLDNYALGRAAAGELYRLFKGGEGMRFDFAVPTAGVAARASSAPSSPGGALVRRALDWIEGHACDGAKAADVVRATGVSRSLLDLRFRELHGTTILGAILDRRLREVTRLLRESDDSIESICGTCGFGDPGGLRRLFRNRHGCSMREWRRRERSGQS